MSPRNEEQNEIIKDERREQILSAALREFATRGFAATKISDIVARGRMSHGLVYHYFKSKEEIFYTLLKRAMETSAQSVMMVEQLPIPPIEKVRQTAKYILGGMESYADSAYYFLIVIHASVMENTDEAHKALMAVSNIALESMERTLKAGQEAGEVREGNAFDMSVAFFAAIQGLALYKLSMQDFHTPDPELLVNMVKKQA
jgi:AcrR family transcriptional regulator